MDTIRQGAAAELWQSLVREACTRCGQALDEAQQALPARTVEDMRRVLHQFAAGFLRPANHFAAVCIKIFGIDMGVSVDHLPLAPKGG